MVELPFLLGDSPLEASSLSPAHGKGHILLDHHVGIGSHHGILEYSSKDGSPLVVRKEGDIHAIGDD